MRQTQRDRKHIKIQLAENLARWNTMTDPELMEEARKTFPALSGTPDRGYLLKYLVMNHVDRID